MMNQAAILGFIRHVLTFGGGYFVQKGLVTGDEVSTAVSAGVTLAGVIWSVLEKRSRK